MAEFPDGVWFLDLAPLRDPALVVSEAAQVLGVREEPGRPLLQTLCAHLQAAARAARPRQLRAPDQAVGRPGQRHPARRAAGAHASPPAARRCACRASRPTRSCRCRCPARGDSLEALSRSTAVRLFVERAQAHKPAFELNEREAPAVAELVARLEGIPLALELAAARVRSLSVADINTRLKDRYKLLTGGSRVLQERQQTLRALVDWSYELLNDAEQTALPAAWRSSPAASTWRRPRRCAAPSRWTRCDVLDLLGSLVEKSLVMLEERDDGSRYRMLETIRDYAREKLAAERRGRRHRGAALRALLRAGQGRSRDGLDGAEQAEWIAARRDRARQPARRDGAGAGRRRRPVHRRQARGGDAGLLDAARLRDRRPRRRARRAGAARRSRRRTCAQAHALYVGAALAESQSDHAEARQMLETCLVLRRGWATRSTSRPRCRRCRWRGCRPAMRPARDGSEREALQIFRELGDRVGEAIGLLHLGQYRPDARRRRAGAVASGSRPGHRARDRAAGDRRRVRACCSARSPSRPATPTAARRCASSDSLSVCRDAGDKRGEANAPVVAGHARTCTPATPPPRARGWRRRCRRFATSRCARSCWAAWRAWLSSPGWSRPPAMPVRARARRRWPRPSPRCGALVAGCDRRVPQERWQDRLRPCRARVE